MRFRVLAIDNDPATLLVVQRALEDAGFDVWPARSGEAGLDLLRSKGLPHLALVDLLLPGLAGGDICRKIKSFSDIPLIILTSVQAKEIVVEAIESFAEDYMVKPFDTRELVARIKRVLYRMGDLGDPSTPVTVDDRLSVDLANQKAILDGREVELGATESKLLFLLMKGAGRPQRTAHLLRRMWPGREIFEDTLRVHIYRLRRKIEPSPGHPRYILTERGIGYRFPERQ